MKKLSKKILAFALALAMMLSYVPSTTYAEEAMDDLQNVQLEAAKRNGIKPLDDDKKIQRLVHDGVLEEISENATYKVDHLTHSYPYLVPKAVMLLEDIGELTQSMGKSRSRIIVTSGLRTKETIAMPHETRAISMEQLSTSLIPGLMRVVF